ncbi:hypothetical protein [Actinomadura sp. NBRC 104425]|uniref:hypothetical protein n=1 Tax=Actinomadura sp. NBRC 104425 TaxID=3032204 RepID=UPI002553DCCE|nr:hypothetical protein [Actinomadura sp. NBRC 104425]
MREPGDFARLHLDLRGITAREADRALRRARLGSLVGDDHALIDLAGLRAMVAEAAADPGWAAGWDAMVEYARGKRWLSDDGTSVRVHVER